MTNTSDFRSHFWQVVTYTSELSWMLCLPRTHLISIWPLSHHVARQCAVFVYSWTFVRFLETIEWSTVRKNSYTWCCFKHVMASSSFGDKLRTASCNFSSFRYSDIVKLGCRETRNNTIFGNNIAANWRKSYAESEWKKWKVEWTRVECA